MSASTHNSQCLRMMSPDAPRPRSCLLCGLGPCRFNLGDPVKQQAEMGAAQEAMKKAQAEHFKIEVLPLQWEVSYVDAMLVPIIPQGWEPFGVGGGNIWLRRKVPGAGAKKP